MCGVAGILRFDGGQPSLGELRRMSEVIAHRGPDGEGHEVLGPCGFAHRRLAIIDLSDDGKQPMSTADGKLWLTYNGEVYNYIELRRELEGLGHRFVSKTDSEVILHAYRQWGCDCFSRFNGMWGLGIYDRDARSLVLSRDRIGIKPLYYHQDKARMIFASEIKALLAHDPTLARLDRRSVARFVLRPSLANGKQTFFEDIVCVAPGSFIRFELDGRRTTRRYWTFRPPVQTDDVPVADIVDRAGEALTNAVRLRFRSDVPVGTCLSGGLDSSSIVSIAAKKLGKAPATFSAVYDEEAYSEGAYVDIMTRELGLESFRVKPDGLDMVDVLERTTYHQESATTGPGIYSQWHVMALAAPHVKVLLDGQGGDEAFAGYHRFFGPYVRSLLDRGRVREAMRASRQIRDETGTDPLRELMGYAVRKFRPTRRTLPAAPLLLPDVARLVDDERTAWGIDRITGDALTDTLWDALVRTSMPGLLHYEDRNSMAFSIEARTPFLDHELLELMFTVPSWMKIRGAETKAILRDAMKDILPDGIRRRSNKMGYPTPFSVWLRRDRGAWARALIDGPSARQRGFFDHAVIRQRLDAHVEGRADHGPVLYQLITLELFCRRFFDAR